MLKKLLLRLAIAFVGLGFFQPEALYARGQFFNYAQQGGKRVVTSNSVSSNQVQLSYPGSTVTVYVSGTLTKAVLFSNSGGTALGNPVTAGTDASFSFWTDTSTFDITFSGKGITTQCGNNYPGYPCISPFTWVGMTWNSSSTNLPFANVTDPPYNAKCDGLTDDAVALQAAIDGVAAAGGELRFPASVCLTSAELTIPLTTKTLRIKGQYANYDTHTGVIGGGSIVRATTLNQRSVLAILPTYGVTIDGILLDGNSKSNYGLYIARSSFNKYENIIAINALYDGFNLNGNSTNFVDGNTCVNCLALTNGKTYYSSAIAGEMFYGNKALIAGTAQLTAPGTIVITGGPDLTALNPAPRKGDVVRIGAGNSITLTSLTSVGTTATATYTTGTPSTGHGFSDQQIVTISGASPAAYNGSYTITTGGPTATTFTYTFAGGTSPATGTITATDPQSAQYLLINSVTATQINLQPGGNNGGTTTAAGQPYAIGVGSGWREEISANNSSTNIIGGVWRSNGATNLQFNSLFGPSMTGGLIDFTNFFGIIVGTADATQTVHMTSLNHPYFEGLGAGSMYVGEATDVVTISPTWSSQTNKFRMMTPSLVNYNGCWVIGGAGLESMLLGARQNFILQIHTTAGSVLQHAILGDKQVGSAAKMVDRINGASISLVNTPTLAVGQGFTNGVGVFNNGGVLGLVLDTNDQVAFVDAQASIEASNSTDTTTSITAAATTFTPVISQVSANINGITRNRPIIYLSSLGGVLTNISGASLGASKDIYVRITMYLK